MGGKNNENDKSNERNDEENETGKSDESGDEFQYFHEEKREHTKHSPISASFEKVQYNESQNHRTTTISGCRNGMEPGGAHQCIRCEKPVHILPCCSISIGDEEGYGERRLCNACASAPKTLETTSPPVSQTVSEMEYNETWNKTKKKTTSKYLKSAPNWNLNNNIQKKVKLGILQNGNLSNTTYKVGNQKVALTNTCAFDSICQVNFYFPVSNYSEYIHSHYYSNCLRRWREHMHIMRIIGNIWTEKTVHYLKLRLLLVKSK